MSTDARDPAEHYAALRADPIAATLFDHADGGDITCRCGWGPPSRSVLDIAQHRTDAIRDALIRAGLLLPPGGETRTWSLPVEPGPEVTAVRCDCHGYRWELVYAPPNGAWSPHPDAKEAELLPWDTLYRQHAPLTDASGEDR